MSTKNVSHDDIIDMSGGIEPEIFLSPQDESPKKSQNFQTSEAIKMSKKRKRGDDPDESEEIRDKFRILENRIRWMSFLDHSWQRTYLGVIGEIFGGELGATSREFVKAKKQIIAGVKNYKHGVLNQCERHIRELYKECPLLQSEEREEWLHIHFYNSYNATNFTFVWNYMKKCVDVEESSELGEFFCKSLYVNICVQTKKWMDVKDSGEPHAVARRDLLSFYDLVPAYDDFNQVTKDDFRVPENRVKNESKRKKRDLAGLNRSTEHTVRGVETFEEGESGDGSRSAPDDNSNRSQNNPIILKDNKCDNSEIDFDPNSHRSKSAEPEADISSGKEKNCPSSHSSRSRALPQDQASLEDPLHIGRRAPRQHRFRLTLGSDTSDKNKQQRQEADNDENNSKDDEESYGKPQQHVDDVVAARTATRDDDISLFGEENESATRARGHRPIPSRDSPEPDQDEMGRHSDDLCNGQFSDTHADSDEEERLPRPNKRKRSSSSHAGPARKKQKDCLQQSSTRQQRAGSRSHRHSLKLPSFGHGSKVAAGSDAEGRLPTGAISVPQAIDVEIPSDSLSFSRPSGDKLPVLSEITFRPHSHEHCSFTAVVRTDRDGGEFSFGQLTRLIEDIGHVGKIDGMTVKPLSQGVFLLTGFSQHTSSRPLRNRQTMWTTPEASRICRDVASVRTKHGRGALVGSTASKKMEQLRSGDCGGPIDGDHNSGGDDDRDTSEAEQGHSRVRNHGAWLALDE